MARRVTCDGCDDELNEDQFEYVVKVERNGALSKSAKSVYDIGPIDLCESCLATLRHKVNPHNWPRAEKLVSIEGGRKSE